MSDIVIGNCGKHPGFNMVNCPMCEIHERDKDSMQFFAVEYAGYWMIQRSPHYGGTDIVNAESVGEKEAEMFAKKIAELLTEWYTTQIPKQ